MDIHKLSQIYLKLYKINKFLSSRIKNHLQQKLKINWCYVQQYYNILQKQYPQLFLDVQNNDEKQYLNQLELDKWNLELIYKVYERVLCKDVNQKFLQSLQKLIQIKQEINRLSHVFVVKKNIAKYENKILQLLDGLEMTKNQISKIKNGDENIQIQEEYNGYEQEYQRLQVEYDKIKNNNIDMQKKCDEYYALQTKYEKMKNQFTALQKTQAQLKRQIGIPKNSNIQDKSRKYITQIKALERKNKLLQTEIQQEKQKIKNVDNNSKNNKTTEDWIKVKPNYKKMEKEYEQKKKLYIQQIKELEQNIESQEKYYKMQLEELQNTKKKEQEEIMNKMKEKEQTQKQEITKRDNIIKNLEQTNEVQNKDYVQQIKALQEKITEIQENRNKQQEKKDKKKNQNINKKNADQIQLIKQEKNEMINKIQHLNQENQKLQIQYTKVIENIEIQYDQKLKEYQKQVDILQIENARLWNEFQDKIEKLTAENTMQINKYLKQIEDINVLNEIQQIRQNKQIEQLQVKKKRKQKKQIMKQEQQKKEDMIIIQEKEEKIKNLIQENQILKCNLEIQNIKQKEIKTYKIQKSNEYQKKKVITQNNSQNNIQVLLEQSLKNMDIYYETKNITQVAECLMYISELLQQYLQDYQIDIILCYCYIILNLKEKMYQNFYQISEVKKIDEKYATKIFMYIIQSIDDADLAENVLEVYRKNYLEQFIV